MRLQLWFRFQTAVHHGTGYGLAGIVDRSVLRGTDGLPILSGAAIKGKMRHAASLIQRAKLGEEALCGPPEDAWCRDKKSPCLLCCVFGSPLIKGKAIFHDATVIDAQGAIIRDYLEDRQIVFQSPGANVRATTAMSRVLGRAESEHLFTSETIAPEVIFESSIEGPLDADEQLLLTQSAKLLRQFGGGSGRGLGWCEVQVSATPEETQS